jgi:hypothetical protein
VYGEHHRVTLRLDGGPAKEHRVPVTDLLTVAGQLQVALRNVAAVLVQMPSGRGGRKVHQIEAATQLDFVAPPRRGSFEVDLELAPLPPTLDTEEFRRMGDHALEALIDGLQTFSDDGPLPRGFDRGVLRNVATIGRVFAHGYTEVELQLNGATAPRIARLDRERVRVARKLIRGPLRARTSVEGVLQMVDLAGDPLKCRVDRPYLASVLCQMPKEWKQQVLEAHGRRVRVEGEGEFPPQAKEPKVIQATRLVLLPDLPGIDREEFKRTHSWRELADAKRSAPVANARSLGGDVFASDEELDAFLASLQGE